MNIENIGCVPEWPNGADCKSAGFHLRWFESIRTHYAFGNKFAPTERPALIKATCSSAFPTNEDLRGPKIKVETEFCGKSRGNSSVDRALAFQAGGRGFESRFPLLCCFSSVVERILGKDEVPSSTLGSSSLAFGNKIAKVYTAPLNRRATCTSALPKK